MRKYLEYFVFCGLTLLIGIAIGRSTISNKIASPSIQAEGVIPAPTEIPKPVEIAKEQPVASPIPKVADSYTEEAPKIQSLKFSGAFLRYPKGASEEQIRDRLPELKCFDFQGSHMCSSPVRLDDKQVILGMPGPCVINQDIKISFDKGALTSVNCEINKAVADPLYDSLNEKYGPGHLERKGANGMVSMHYEFKTGSDYVMITQWNGNDMYGSPINKLDVTISAHESLGEN